MIMPPILRKLALIVHIVASVSWMGAVASYLALAIAGLNTYDIEVQRACYITMDLTARLVIVPLCFAALLTGVVQSLGTTWGLFRHYWVLIKLLLTVVATVLLVAHTEPIRYMANIASVEPLSMANFGRLRLQLAYDASAALLLLLVIAVLSVYKPRGVTPYGRRKQREQRQIMQV